MGYPEDQRQLQELFFVVVAQGSLGGCKESGAEVLQEEGVLTLPIVVSTHTLGAQQPRPRRRPLSSELTWMTLFRSYSLELTKETGPFDHRQVFAESLSLVQSHSHHPSSLLKLD